MIIPIVYVISENFVVPAIVSAMSAIENNRIKLEFHFLVTDIKNSYILEQAKKEFEKRGCIVFIKNVNSNVLKIFNLGLVKNRRIGFSQSIFAKILISKLIERELVVYLDADTLIGNCLENLYSTNLEDNYLGAVADASESAVLKREYLAQFKLKHYFNSGVMLMNIAELERNHFLQECLNVEKAIGSKKQFADQDLYNIVLTGHVILLESRFNNQLWYKIPNDIWLQRLEQSKNGIAHFIGPVKPWQEWHRTDVRKLWKHYASLFYFDIKTIPITNLRQLMIFSDMLDTEEKYFKSSKVKSQIIHKLMNK